jgi:hypothetical protein
MNMKQLVRKIGALATQTAALQKHARELGLFTNDRELLECAKCGLLEDVSFEGRLLTCWPESLGQDTGLRFEKMPNHRFRCPSCGSTVREPVPIPLPAKAKTTNAKRR